MPTFNSQSSHTADGLVYRRTLTNIPFAKEIFEIFKKLEGDSSAEDVDRPGEKNMVPFFEARYLMTDRELKKSGASQFLELASGLSPRGIAFTADAAITYVEFDLPEKLTTKREVIAQLIAQGNITPRQNLFLEEGNVTSAADFKKACRHFKNEPVAVTCEGLLRYVSPEDRKILAQNIYTLLKKNGGVWTTPDLEFLDVTKSSPEEQKRYDDRVQRFGYDVRPNLFRDEQDAVAFFESCGFKVAKHPLVDIVDELVSPSRVGLSKEDAVKSLASRFSFTMTVN